MHLLCDIDHTLSSAFWRDHLMGQWDAYHAASVHDQPIQEVMQLVRDLQNAGWTAIGFTARPSKWRLITLQWLAQHDIVFSELLMRDDDMWRPSVEVKCELLARLQLPSHEPVIILDDHPDVCAAINKNHNITVMQVHARKQEQKS